ncbi:MAG1210 family protein [Mycoplasmopsis verecunda]|uniref:Uncharacterized protein n=1 Tax=Mycoplasmopsis verecunda TaxID=171291 RepID=A0A1T4L3X6_9BACT|nr:hypothetical protein [Mycoplasmopsis verecunda]WPB54445.1 hypothetical protein SAM46_03085 [Mycoplasmopsis verecunda]SJZ49257.1 hypothetical protein SAMN02745154_00311 [Mycoplasmopsis verecunda]
METENILDNYQSVYKPKMKEEVANFFNMLTEKSKIDLTQAEELETKFNTADKKKKSIEFKLRISRNARQSFVIQIVFSIIFTLISIYYVYFTTTYRAQVALDSSNTSTGTVLYLFLALNVILALVLFVGIIVVPIIRALKASYQKYSMSNVKGILANEISNLVLALGTTLTFIFLSIVPNSNQYYGLYIASIVWLTFWSLMIFVDIALFIYFLIINKNINQHLEMANSELKSIGDEVKENLDPLYKICCLEGIKEILVDKIFPFIKLNFKTSQELMEIADIRDQKDYLLNNENERMSIKRVQSGFLNNAPFVSIIRNHRRYVNETYVGSTTVEYEKVRFKYVNGRQVKEKYMHTETLTASYRAPKPYYYDTSELIYYNDLMPQLEFKCSPDYVGNLNKKQLDKLIAKQSKMIRKLANDNINYQPIMGNLTFESLFNCKKRNNEKEFRMLFTPLAQKQYEKLLTSREISNDHNFDLAKLGKLHILKEQNLFALLTYERNLHQKLSPYWNTGVTYTNLKNSFIHTYVSGFDELFKTLAPFIAIPMYMEQEINYKFNNDWQNNLAAEEIESLLNRNISLRDGLKHPEASDYGLIFDVTKKSQNGDKVHFTVTTYGYKQIEHTEYISVKAGDNNRYDVPVNWIEYQEVKKISNLTLTVDNISPIDEFLQNTNSK